MEALRGDQAGNLVNRASDFLFRKVQTAPGACCFAAGTLVWTSSGLTPIEQIRVGELVLTRHHESGEIGWYPVTGLIETPQSALLVLTLRHAGGHVQIVETTDEHPYRVGESWTRADELSVGSVVRTFDGEAVVESIQLGGRREPVYNITVGGAHSYLVGYEMVWVHNCGAGYHHLIPFYLRGIKRDGSIGDVFLTSAQHSELHRLINDVGSRHGIPKMSGAGNGAAAVDIWADKVGADVAEQKMRETLIEAYSTFDARHGTNLWADLMGKLIEGPIR